MELSSIKPVFIIGTGHSGTSILYKMLAMHPDLAWFSQYSCRGGEIPNRFTIPFYKYLNRILRLFFKHNWSKKEIGLKIIPRPGDAEQIWDCLIPRNSDISEEEIINKIQNILTAECRNWKKFFIILKNIRFYRYLPTLKRAFPEAKFIHIVRDGRAVALSRIKYLKKAEEWKRALETVNQERKNLDFFELKYEDFCNDVGGYLKKIFNFIGLNAAEFSADKFPGALTSKNQQWLNEFNADKIKQIENIQKEMLKKYGYL